MAHRKCTLAEDGRKTCGTCHVNLPVSAFGPERDTRDGYTSSCRSCANIRSRRYRVENPERHKEYDRKDAFENPIPQALIRIRGRKEKWGGLTEQHMRREAERGTCFYCAAEIRSYGGQMIGLGRRRTPPDAISWDRVDPEALYSDDNVVACCFRCNTIKSLGTAAEHRMIADRMDAHSRGEK